MDRTELAQELALVAASLRAHLEWQEETGATGIPRGSTSTIDHRPSTIDADRRPSTVDPRPSTSTSTSTST
ncbi:MAG: hypothetical protein ACRELY_02930, partial [Polyangiaceae bacterium]